MCSFVASVSFLFSAVVIISQILGALLVGVLRVENSEVKSYTVRRNVSSKVQQVSWVTDSYLQSQYNNISLNINNISY